jgi:AraC-like DNA-binding protein
MADFTLFPVSPLQQKWGIYLTNCGREKIPAHYKHYPPKSHVDAEAHVFDVRKRRRLPNFQIVYVCKGQGYYENEQCKRQLVRAGSVFLYFADVWCGHRPDPKIGWEVYWISFAGEIATRLMAPPFFMPQKPVITFPDPEQFESRMEEYLSAINEKPVHELSPFSVTGGLLDLIGHLHEDQQRSESETEDRKKIRKAEELIHKEAYTEINFDQLAQKLGYSRRSFFRKFEAIVHSTPLQYQLAIRLNRAQRLLLSTDLPIAEIAVQCGFSSIHYFTRLFAQKTGRTPTRYRASSEMDGA